MSNVIKSTFKPFVDEFEKIGSQTVKQTVQTAKQVASDIVQKPIQETVGNPPLGGDTGVGTNEDQGAQNQAFQQQMMQAKLNDQQKTQQQIAQIRQNLKALMTPQAPPPKKPIYYKMWEAMEKKKQEKMELEAKKQEENVAVRAAGKSTGEMKKGIGG